MTLTVTVIDDHTLFREGLQGLLERHGIQVLDSVGDAKSGYAAISQRRPDVILLDLRLPQANGLDILRKLKEDTECPPVVILTMSDEAQDVVEALRSGASGYLLKDMEPDTLVMALRSIVEGETVVAPSLTPTLARVVQGHEPEPSAKEESPFGSLTPRESEILMLLAEGMSNRSIGNSLGISEGTVKLHVKAILRKLEVTSRVAAAVLAVEHGWAGRKSPRDREPESQKPE